MADIAPAQLQIAAQQSNKKKNEDELDFDDMDEWLWAAIEEDKNKKIAR